MTSPRAGNITGIAAGNCTLTTDCEGAVVAPGAPITCGLVCAPTVAAAQVSLYVMGFPFASPSTPVLVTIINAPTMCAMVTAPTLELLNAPAWADGATYCGSIALTMRSQPGMPPIGTCAFFTDTVS